MGNRNDIANVQVDGRGEGMGEQSFLGTVQNNHASCENSLWLNY